ncbi:MAG: glutamyl-tRNA amidotransferase [Candidatus Schekmanbacteria bacterium RBG_16_38_11]|uniref:Glutamyl-tRNA amidotransferase n=1 Tax=Candidatus Schekmanbacteria bacterium RBG_16_38_11 TaxID=1817880 RepID=A0A1F7RZD5_9BACT|nr:MAG: glutamyl-tRNA amidotransferase [Candidatus Schekmanbacteria bacterium RBG_16_38_11]
MNLKEKLMSELKDSMKQGNKSKVSVIRLLLSSIKNKEIDKMGELSDGDMMTILSQAAKIRREAIEGFEKGNRDDLVQKEKEELEIIGTYLPVQISEERLREIVKEVILEVSATSAKDIGKVMKALMPKIRGQADGKVVNKIVQQALENQQ